MKKIIISLTLISSVIITGFAGNVIADEINLKMVFVPASEKGDDQDYISLIRIIEKLTGYKIEPIKVTDYNAAVESTCVQAER